MVRAYVVVLCALTACIETGLVLCENGIACPAGTVCDEPHKTCVTPEQATACAFLPENAPCLDNGACHHGICVPIECGNWLRDPLEMCDDGNTISGDGCSADCTTNETCGNGVIDPALGETCDDGDLASHDGCDSQCRTETLSFTQLAQTTDIAVEFAGYAFDDARNKLVMFGGVDAESARIGATFEIDGTTKTFSVRTPSIAPTPRYGANLAYDAKRNVVVLFGGSDLSGLVSDTWTWNGEDWRPLAPAASPPPRMLAGVTYDSRRRRVLLYGGRSKDGPLADLWSWDGTTWTDITPAVSPPARERMMFAYDPLHDRVVMFGGMNGSAQPDMWLFDGTAWMALTPPGLPSARYGGTLTFDAMRGGLVMIGGSSASPTQLWDGNQWTPIGISNTPMTARVHHVAFYDPAFRTTVAGLGSIASAAQRDLFRLDNDVWSPLVQSVQPPPLAEASLAYDARRGEVVMFGGATEGPLLSQDTWIHDGSTWVKRAPMDPPPARHTAAMAYDERRGKTVMFGGNTSDADVYEWDGLAWSKLTAAGPSPRARAEMAYDAESKTVVLFGGDGPSGRLGDTWQWNGAVWTELATSPSPPAREQHALAYDRVRGEIVLFGGVEESGARLGDTWTWTASGGWVERTPLASPSPRVRAVMASDPIRGEVVLFGGSIGGGALDDTWAWDGTTWLRRFPRDLAPPTDAGAATYDNARRHVLVQGPHGTWRLQWRGVASDEACRSGLDRDGDSLRGCADPDCAAFCTPLCPDGAQTCDGPVCGDQMCSPLESCRLCDRDCGFCTARCGDTYCDGGESCSGECPS